MSNIIKVVDQQQFDLRSSMFKDIHDYTKFYPDRAKVIKYKRPIVKEWTRLPHSGSGIEHDEDSRKEDNLKKSINRTKTTISDYVLCNDFNIFATFTFDPKIITEQKRHDFEYCSNLLSEWLRVEQQNHQRNHKSKFRYLVVPEKHKNGAWHFHALIADYKNPIAKFKEQSNKYFSIRTDKNLNKSYFFKRYNLGRNEFQIIKSKDRMASYIKKYITKSLLQYAGKKRYWSSRNLKKPAIFYNIFKYDKISDINITYDCDFYTIYELRQQQTPIIDIFNKLFNTPQTSRIEPAYQTAGALFGEQLKLFQKL